MYYVIDNEDHTRQPQSFVLIGIVASLIVTTIQQMGVFSTMAIPWEDPIKTLLNVMMLMNFNIEVLRFGCVATFSDFERFTIKLISILIALVTVVFIHACWVVIKHKCAFRERIPSLVGAMGTIFMVFQIAIVNTCILPLQCYSQNPNGLATVRSYPNIICHEDSEHSAMMAIGLLFLLIPIGFVAGCSYATYLFP